jgi:uncharacterized protein DUF4404
MDKQQLHDKLQQLQNELQQIDSADEDERQILQKVIGDISKLIEAGDTDQPHVDRLGEGLREGIERLEASHPRVTMLMGQLVDALAKIGI